MTPKRPDTEPDITPDIQKVVDRGERVALMEPLVLSSESKFRPELTDLALELARKSAALESSLPPGVRQALTALVRTMNCYYSNLIEGHNTHPTDIERAVHGQLDTDQKKRNLQLEARAHVQAQAWIDENAQFTQRPTNTEFICALHRKFCDALPAELLFVEDPDSKERERVLPGEIRKRDVKVGAHIAVSPGAVKRFLDRYEDVYCQLGSSETVLAAAAAHHRLLWIHPFVDGNGRVARLIAYAQLRDALKYGGTWSIARGLARTVQDYKRHLMACDNERWNDYDGRGHLSENALGEFSRYFLQVCIDQAEFMESLVEPGSLHQRILRWCEAEAKAGRLASNAGSVMQAVLYRGELPRGEVPGILGLGDRQSRRVVATLIDAGVLVANSDRAPLRIAFPAAFATQWMPGLFPAKPST